MSSSDAASDAVSEVLAGPSGPSIGAFFDYDGTVIHGFSAGAFYSHRIRQLEIGPVEAFNTIRHTIRGVTTETEFERLMGVVFQNLAGRPFEELSAIGEKIFAKQIAGRVFPEAWQLIRAHERMGHTLVLASSASRFQVEPAARSLGIAHVLCTDAEVNENGKLTGRTKGNALWREGKAQAVLDFAREQKIRLDESFAYSNGDEDVPFLSTVGRPRAVNPGKVLLAHAQKSDWPVFRFADRGRPSLPRIARTTAAYGGMATAMGAGLAFGLLNRNKQVGLDTVSSLIGDLALPLVGVRLNVQGEEHLWSHRPAVFLFNHQSQLDMPILCKLLRGGFTAVAKKELASDPLFGVAFRAAGVAFVDRSGKADPRTALDPAVQKLREGISVVVAPEGTRSVTPALDPGIASAMARTSSTGNVASSRPATTSVGTAIEPNSSRLSGRSETTLRTAKPAERTSLRPATSMTRFTASGRSAREVGPRKALTTEPVSGGRIPRRILLTSSRAEYWKRWVRGAGDAVPFISTSRPALPPCRAPNTPPTMAPQELPRRWARSTPRASRISTTQSAQSASENVPVKALLRP